jgi:hypothetical protein
MIESDKVKPVWLKLKAGADKSKYGWLPLVEFTGDRSVV